jgi:hypothetical protein
MGKFDAEILTELRKLNENIASLVNAPPVPPWTEEALARLYDISLRQSRAIIRSKGICIGRGNWRLPDWKRIDLEKKGSFGLATYQK